jgi:metallophosphoesterase superfamily enzyme
MPSFNMLSEGTDILAGELLGPFLHQDLDDFEVYVVEDKVYRFGKVKDLRNHPI